MEKSESMDQRREFVLKAVGTLNFRELCREYGISAKTGYKWRERFLRRFLRQAQELWREEFNRERPHGALRMRCPAELYRDWNRPKARGGVMNQLRPSWAKGYPGGSPGVGRPQHDLIGPTYIEVIANDPFKPHPASLRSVKHIGVGDLKLAEGQLVDIAGLPVPDLTKGWEEGGTRSQRRKV